MVVMRIPTVALMSGEGSPTAPRHSLLMKVVTSLGSAPKCAFTLFLRMRPGGNCIKIGLPGKLILRDYFQENRTSR